MPIVASEGIWFGAFAIGWRRCSSTWATSVEAQAATAYWAAWAPVPMRFAKRDLARVPEHWRTFGIRASPITGTSRSAGNPINALLNYTYTILETEVRLAILAMGPDPGMGMLHADLKNRDSLVYDLLEPLRPIVDGYVLTLLEERSFAVKKFSPARSVAGATPTTNHHARAGSRAPLVAPPLRKAWR